MVIDAVGRPETWQQAFYGRDLAGTVVLVGVPTPDMQPGDAADRLLLPRRRTEVLLVRRLPALAGTSRCWSTCYLQGRLPLDAFVSETIGLGDVEEAFERMGSGDVLRSVVVFD